MLPNHSLIVAVPAFILLLAMLVLRRLKDISPAATLLFSIYIGSTASAIFIDPVEWFPYFHEGSYTPQIMVAYGLLLLLSLWPALKLAEAPSNLRSFNPSWLKIAMWVMIIGGTYAIIYQLPYASQASAINADDFRREMNQNQIYMLPDSPATTLAVFFSTFYMLHIALAFQSMIIGGSALRTGLLWITSISNLVSGATFATRDASVFYVFALAFNYFYFRSALGSEKRKAIRNIIFILSACIVLYIAHISIQRFLNLSGNSLSWGTLGYFSSQPYTFAEAVYNHNNFYNGDLRFPFIKMFFNNFSPIIVERHYNYETMFGTFLKDFYCEGGWVFLISGIFMINVIFRGSISNRDGYFLSSFIMQTLYVQFMFTGIFYFALGSRQGNIYTLILFVLFIMCRCAEQSNYRFGTKRNLA